MPLKGWCRRDTQSFRSRGFRTPPSYQSSPLHRGPGQCPPASIPQGVRIPPGIASERVIAKYGPHDCPERSLATEIGTQVKECWPSFSVLPFSKATAAPFLSRLETSSRESLG